MTVAHREDLNLESSPDDVPARWPLALGIVLLILAAAYQIKGHRLLLSDNQGAGGGDLRQRWLEQRYVQRGQNPYDVIWTRFKVGRPPVSTARDAREAADLEAPDSGGYPPWAFFSGYVLLWPDWPQTRLYYVALNALAVLIVGLWAARQASSPAHACLLFAATSAISAHCTSLLCGQYGAIVTAFLVGSLWADDRGHHKLAGLLLGIALLKPTIAAPFFLCLLVKRRWAGLAVCCLYLAVASATIWAMTNTDPLEMLLQMSAAGQSFVQDSAPGGVQLLLTLGVPRAIVTPLLAVGILLPALVLLWICRHHPMSSLFAIAAVAGRFWAYHKNYDNMMLVFLLVALGATLHQPQGRRIRLTSFLLVGISLWMPASVTENWPFAAFQFAAWIGGLAILLKFSQPEVMKAVIDQPPQEKTVRGSALATA